MALFDLGGHAFAGWLAGDGIKWRDFQGAAGVKGQRVDSMAVEPDCLPQMNGPGDIDIIIFTQRAKRPWEYLVIIKYKVLYPRIGLPVGLVGEI